MLQAAAIVVYIAAAALIGLGIHRQKSGMQRAGVALSIVGVALHALTLLNEFAAIGGFGADFFTALSAVSLLTMLVMLIAMIRYQVRELLMLALPGSAFMVLLKLALGPTPEALETGRPLLDVHIVVSLLSYSMFSIAAITAMFIAATHSMLHRRTRIGLLEILPPLVSTETLLFKMITAGWIGLTFSLVTGLVFVDDLFAQKLGHKTFLSIIAWVIFGLLLAGRWRYGWRGMRAVRLTLIGMAILLLAYFGSKAVLELILDLRWRSD